MEVAVGRVITPWDVRSSLKLCSLVLMVVERRSELGMTSFSNNLKDQLTFVERID